MKWVSWRLISIFYIINDDETNEQCVILLSSFPDYWLLLATTTTPVDTWRLYHVPAIQIPTLFYTFNLLFFFVVLAIYMVVVMNEGLVGSNGNTSRWYS